MNATEIVTAIDAADVSAARLDRKETGNFFVVPTPRGEFAFEWFRWGWNEYPMQLGDTTFTVDQFGPDSPDHVAISVRISALAERIGDALSEEWPEIAPRRRA